MKFLGNRDPFPSDHFGVMTEFLIKVKTKTRN